MSQTIEEVAELLQCSKQTLKNFVYFHPDALTYFHKEYKDIIHMWRNKAVKHTRKFWVIDDDKIDDFLAYWAARRKQGRPKAKHLPGLYRWTKWARDCYEVRCICKNCMHNIDCARIEKEITHTRNMKNVVIELVKEIGIPPERINEE